MRNDVVLGISIDAGEILSVLIDGASGELLAQNRMPISPQSDLIATIDRLIRSAPETITSVGIACADPSTQILLNQARRSSPAPQTDEEDDDDAIPAWLLAASITSIATAVAVVAARQFAGMGKILVVNVDGAGHTAAVQPMVLVDPLTESVVDTATLPAGTPPVQEMAGANAVADSMSKMPGRGRDVEMIASAGAGSDIPHLASTLGAATGLGVQPLDHGEFAVAHGAAALTKSNEPAPMAAAAGPGKRKGMLLAGAAGLAVSAALIGGSAYLIKNGDSESPRNADVVAPFSVSSTTATSTKTPSATSPRITSPSRGPSTTTTVEPTTTTAVTVDVTPETTSDRPVPIRVPGRTTSSTPTTTPWTYTPPSRPSVTRSTSTTPPPSPSEEPSR
ncbi:hypothetical protein [Williamsia soli]|uniref:hypothetical protein n=1 Tax=Williamsia soli TaxID=364929 RepID=UPI001A9E1E2C|nr:hypothetical protein [Williamsia soli]